VPSASCRLLSRSIAKMRTGPDFNADWTDGSSLPGIEADADHLFEAAKYGGFFITHDDRILTRAGRLGEVLPPSLTVITHSDFLAIFDDYAARYLR
jgi:hypothetical protein